MAEFKKRLYALRIQTQAELEELKSSSKGQMENYRLIWEKEDLISHINRVLDLDRIGRELIEIPDEFKDVKKALSDFSEGTDEDLRLMQNSSYYAGEAMKYIGIIFGEVEKKAEKSCLFKNVKSKFSEALLSLEEIKKLSEEKEQVLDWTKNDRSRTVAASFLASTSSAKKAKSSRENGKKGGRPKKNAETPKTSAKKVSKKSSS